MLYVIKELLPKDNHLSLLIYEAKMRLSSLGMEYEKVYACPNDCILYKGEYKDVETCPTCNESR